MSRIGTVPIQIPENIYVYIDGPRISIQGPKGQLSYQVSNLIKVENTKYELKLHPLKENDHSRAIHGLSRTIINNMMIGVSEGFKKQLEIHGVGYRLQMEEKNLILNVGYSHPITIKPPEGISISIENNTKIIISGINKEIVGQVAAKIRSIRPPEPYKGKGIRYMKEKIKRKVGKAGK